MTQKITSSPLISVVVPVFNTKEYLQKCVNSIIKQSYQNLEILLIDDGSYDGSERICDDYAAMDSRIQTIHQQNHGLSAVRNIGIHAAQGEYLAFVDADDWVDESYVSELYQACIRWDVPLSCCNHLIVNDRKQMLRFSKENARVLSAEEAMGNLLYHGIPDVSVWGKLIKRNILNTVVYPEGHVFEDTYCIVELVKNAKKLAFVEKPLYFYRIRSDSISRDRFCIEKLDFIDSVNHMTDEIERLYPGQYKEGIARRKMHALLSTRRYLVDCPLELVAIRNQLDEAICSQAENVLRDRKIPLRDRVAIHAVLLGHRSYDCLWKVLKKSR